MSDCNTQLQLLIFKGHERYRSFWPLAEELRLLCSLIERENAFTIPVEP